MYEELRCQKNGKVEGRGGKEAREWKERRQENGWVKKRELGSKEAEGLVCKGAEEKLNVVGPNF